MNKTLFQLYDLQHIDTELDEVLSLRGNLPEKVKQLEIQLEEVKDKRDRFEQKFEEVKNEVKSLEAQTEKIKSELEHDEKIIYEVTNNKEYDAITAQIKNHKTSIEENDTKIAELVEKEVLLKEHLDKYVAEYDAEVEELAALNNQLKDKIETTESEEKRLIKKREAERKKINDRHLRVYDQIRSNKEVAITYMERNSCAECRSIIPLQQQAEIRNKKDVVFCESCGRIVVHDEEHEKAEIELLAKREAKKSEAAKEKKAKKAAKVKKEKAAKKEQEELAAEAALNESEKVEKE